MKKKDNKEETSIVTQSKEKQKEYNVFIDKEVSDSQRGYANQHIELVCSESGKTTRIVLIF